MNIIKGNMGWIEVIVGPMFAGKSEELIRLARRSKIAGHPVQLFKPIIDQRYASNEIASHSGLGLRCETVSQGWEIMTKVQSGTEVVGIDEAQFLGDGLIDTCTHLANLGKRVIVAGLDTDFRGRPFEPIPTLLAIAEEIRKLLAICMRCGNPAVRTQRLVENDQLIMVGATGTYEARCRQCFEPNVALARTERSIRTSTPITSMDRPATIDKKG